MKSTIYKELKVFLEIECLLQKINSFLQPKEHENLNNKDLKIIKKTKKLLKVFKKYKKSIKGQIEWFFNRINNCLSYYTDYYTKMNLR